MLLLEVRMRTPLAKAPVAGTERRRGAIERAGHTRGTALIAEHAPAEPAVVTAPEHAKLA
jgi:hypothetical protein